MKLVVNNSNVKFVNSSQHSLELPSCCLERWDRLLERVLLITQEITADCEISLPDAKERSVSNKVHWWWASSIRDALGIKTNFHCRTRFKKSVQVQYIFSAINPWRRSRAEAQVSDLMRTASRQGSSQHHQGRMKPQQQKNHSQWLYKTRKWINNKLEKLANPLRRSIKDYTITRWLKEQWTNCTNRRKVNHRIRAHSESGAGLRNPARCRR